MQVDLKEFIPDDKNFKANSNLFMGTTRQSFGIGKYVVQMLFLGMAIPSKVCPTDDEAKELEAKIWEKMK